MTTFIAGADRSGIRLILQNADRTEEFLPVPPGERNELALCNAFLKRHEAAWLRLDAIIHIHVPHSRTSVRVLGTVLAVASHFFNIPMTTVTVEELFEYE